MKRATLNWYRGGAIRKGRGQSMSDKPKALQRTANLRWFVLSAAGLLTVVGLFLEWIEVMERGAAPSSFVWGFARLAWIGFMLLCCTMAILRKLCRMEKRNDRNTEKIIEAICDQRVGNLARLMEEGDIKSIYRKG